MIKMIKMMVFMKMGMKMRMRMTSPLLLVTLERCYHERDNDDENQYGDDEGDAPKVGRPQFILAELYCSP